MKKGLLLFLSVFAMIATAMADTATIDPDGAGVTWTATTSGFTTTVDGFTVTTDKANSTTTLVAPTDLIKVYKSSTITIDGGSATITGITFTCSGSSYVKSMDVDSGTATIDGVTIVWTGSASKVTFTASGGQSRINQIDITYTTNTNGAKKPTLTAGGVFTTKPYTVTITNNEGAGTTYYTTDGTDPTTTSASFTETEKTIEISETTTVKAMTAAEGKDNSDIATATYTYEDPIANTLETALTTAEAIALIDAGSAQLKTTSMYVKGTVSKVASYNATYGSITYWLDNDTYEVYGGLNNNGEKFASIDDVKVGAEVVVYGLITKYGTTYESNTNNWLVSYTAPAKPEPTLTATVKNAMEVGDTDTFSMTYNGDAAFTATSSVPEVATIEWSEDDLEYTVTALKAGTTTISISTPETENYMPKTFSYTLTVSEKLEAAALPFTFDGGKADATPGKGMIATGLGSNYSYSPMLKFDGTGDNLVIKIADTAKYLVYTIKGNSFTNASTFDVQESADGETYTSLKSYTDAFNETNECIDLKADTRFVKFVYTNKGAGNVALGAIEITNAAQMADFEAETLDAESVKQYATESGAATFNAGSRYTFTNYNSYGYYYAYTLTDKTTTTANADYTNAYESACGGAKSGKNYVVWYDNSYNGGDSIVAPVARRITGFYISNTTYTENVLLNGNSIGRAFTQEGDTLTLNITGYRADGSVSGTVKYNLAEVKDGMLSYVKAWRWVDLTALGKAAWIKFSMDSSDKGQWGVNTPTYFCMDDFGGEAPTEDAPLEVVDTATAIAGVNAANSNVEGKFLRDGRIVILKNGRTYNAAGQMLK